ncbi:ANR family transcriptional regulator [Escherichia coli]
MNGFRRNSRNVQCRNYQQAGGQAVRLEVRGRWQEAARAWRRAAHMASRADWQQFALQRAEHCQRRCRGNYCERQRRSH